MKKRTADIKIGKAVLRTADFGVLSTVDAQGMPYGVAVNFMYDEEANCIYFHSKRGGKKIENIQAHPRVSLFASANEAIIPDWFITHYDSVIVNGTAHIITDDDEIRAFMKRFCDCYAPGVTDRRDAVIEKFLHAILVVRIDIEEITSKQNRDI